MLAQNFGGCQWLGASDIGFGKFDLRLLPGHLGVGAIDSDLKRSLVEREQQITSLDQRAFLEMDLLDEAGNARADVSARNSFKPARGFVPRLDALRQRRRDGNANGWRRRILSARGRGEGDKQKACGKQSAQHHET